MTISEIDMDNSGRAVRALLLLALVASTVGALVYSATREPVRDPDLGLQGARVLRRELGVPGAATTSSVETTGSVTETDNAMAALETTPYASAATSIAALSVPVGSPLPDDGSTGDAPDVGPSPGPGSQDPSPSDDPPEQTGDDPSSQPDPTEDATQPPAPPPPSDAPPGKGKGKAKGHLK